MGAKSTVVLLILLLILVFSLESCSTDSRHEEINNKIIQMNGTPVSIEDVSIYFSDTPFTWNTKEMRISKFKYIINGEEKTGWLRTRAFGNDWILDGKKEE